MISKWESWKASHWVADCVYQMESKKDHQMVPQMTEPRRRREEEAVLIS
jgi:hypothetical protein